jgi:hypothetical protein
MMTQRTIDKLLAMKLDRMVASMREQMQNQQALLSGQRARKEIRDSKGDALHLHGDLPALHVSRHTSSEQ